MTHPTKQSAPAWTFSSRKPGEHGEDYPGPGIYSPSNRDRVSGGVFGTSNRGDRRFEDSPGPAGYDHLKSIGDEGPKYTLRAKTKYGGDREGSPGPGNYDPFD
jgi:hypothetical protein